MPGSASLPLVPQLRRVLDLAGAAALGASLVHFAIAIARGWPRAPWIDVATSNVVLGVFALLAVLYSIRWFYPGANRAGRPGAAETLRRAYLTSAVRASGVAVAVAVLVGLIVALLEHPGAAEAAVRGYYVAIAVIVLTRWIAARRRS